MAKYTEYIKGFFKTKDGKIIIWQFPNIPIIVWGIGLVISKVFNEGIIHDLASAVSFGAIFTWAYLEIFQGVNYFRRALGVVVLTISLFGKINTL